MKKIMCMVASMTLMLMGDVSGAVTTKAWDAIGIDPDPCPKCQTGSVWHYEEHEDVLLGTRICIDGFTKGIDAHYQNIYLYKTQCIDCDAYLEYEEVRGSGYWVCEGYNTPPSGY